LGIRLILESLMPLLPRGQTNSSRLAIGGKSGCCWPAAALENPHLG
jgi:hypothetical protein